MRRRDVLRALGALPLVASGCLVRESEELPAAEPARAPGAALPVLFAAHGAPPLLEDAEWMAELAAWSAALPRPRAVLVLSAHWERRPATLSATQPVPLIYDFYGFPQRFYERTYAAPGAPELAERVRALLTARGQEVADAPTRGLDHGAWVPLLAMYPAADVPVLQLSLPGLDPWALVELGRALAPLRAEGVLVLGSGFLTHNLAHAFDPGVPSWARDFDAWTADALARRDVDALARFREVAPGAREAHPTWEHYAPLLVAVGAAEDARAVSFPITGWWHGGSLTKRSVQLG
ncbi:MAG: dioxygenase [Planctomycetes bacterium]|nr:dioxygenase [Planctomycetota bacterium]